MSKVSFTQTTTPDGQISVALFSSDLPAGGFTFSLAFGYTSSNIEFDKVNYSGGASTKTSSGILGTMGTVSIEGSLSPSSGAPFATILFNAAGKGTFDLSITSFKVNGLAPIYTDPLAYEFSIKDESVALFAGGSATGSYKPIDGFFGMSYGVKTAPQNGKVVYGATGDPSSWKYTPDAGFYGVDSFTLKVSDVFDTKEKTVSVIVSPVGTPENDIFHSSAGTYRTDGGSGIDTLQYTGKRANFTVTKSGVNAIVTDDTGNEGTNYLDNFERLIFSDSAIALDVSGNGGQAYRIYQAAFNRAPDGGGLGYWINALDKGLSLASVAEGFINSNEFKSVYGSAPTNDELITRFYENILHRAPEKAGFDYWVNVLNSEAASTAQVLASISESAENQNGLAAVIGNGFEYIPYGTS